MNQLKGKTAIITGASSGIGMTIAQELAKEGANVVLAARSVDKLKDLEKEINDLKNGRALAVQTDISKREDVENLVKEAEKTFEHVDILVNNAGQMLSSAVRSGKVDEWDLMIDVNIKGVLYGINSVLPSMTERAQGHIINIASVSGLEVSKQSAVYSATKYAVRAISMGLEKELAQTGVRVTNISPGMVETPLSEASKWNERKKLTTENIAQGVIYALTQPAHVNVNEITIRPV